MFVHRNGSLLKEGDVLYRPKQADLLEVIANEGGAALYTGSLAPELLADLRDIGTSTLNSIKHASLWSHNRTVKDPFGQRDHGPSSQEWSFLQCYDGLLSIKGNSCPKWARESTFPIAVLYSLQISASD